MNDHSDKKCLCFLKRRYALSVYGVFFCIYTMRYQSKPLRPPNRMEYYIITAKTASSGSVSSPSTRLITSNTIICIYSLGYARFPFNRQCTITSTAYNNKNNNTRYKWIYIMYSPLFT